MANPLTDKVVLITGASAGIGEGVAIQAAEQGAKLVLSSRREGVLQNVKDLILKQGTEAVIVPADMAKTEEVKALAQTALDHFGRVDILVNNAGYGQMGPVEEVDEASVRHQFEVNLFGLLTLTRALLPQMRDRGQGRIINVSSVAGQVSMPFSGIYNASKHALEAISDALRVEVAPFGVKVIVIEPGPVSTDFFRVARETAMAVTTPMGPYRNTLDAMEDMASSITNTAWTPEQVATQILKAMTDAKPAPRYTAFRGGKLGLGLLRVMPTALADRLWVRMFGLDQANRA